jgi:hypothetical protein
MFGKVDCDLLRTNYLRDTGIHISNEQVSRAKIRYNTSKNKLDNATAKMIDATVSTSSSMIGD